MADPDRFKPPEGIRNFREMVRTMRTLQKAYFKNRRPSDLHASKEAERRVDNWLARDAKGMRTSFAEPGLFDGEKSDA